jgi:hypothetical protein
MQRRLAGFLSCVALAVSASACSNSSSTGTPTNPSTPSLVTDAFTGTVNPHGADTKFFLVLTAGDMTATLTDLSGDGTIIGLELGTSADGITCQNVLSNDSARAGTVMIGRASGGPAAFCARVYDTGHLTDSVDYTLQVVHP